MREIKFRGKHHNEWKYGSLIIDSQFHARIVVQNPYQWYDVDINTVGQFTGVKDEKHNEIYEGDVILKKVLAKNFNQNYYVEYCKQRAMFILIYGRTTSELNVTFSDGVNYLCESLEVVGNIHDKDEFLSALAKTEA